MKRKARNVFYLSHFTFQNIPGLKIVRMENKRSQLIWRCRRGIREMDILFTDFIEQHYDQLSEVEKQGFSKLLDEADLNILNWIMGKDKPETDELMHIITIIRDSRNIT